MTLTLRGASSGSTLSDGVGNYSFAGLASGGNYSVTPTKSALVSGSAGINAVDVIAVQRHFLSLVLLTGCRLTAGDVNGDATISTVDVIAIQRFFLGLGGGVANAGKYQFNPAGRTYANLTGDLSDQNFDVIVVGDVAAPFVTP